MENSRAEGSNANGFSKISRGFAAVRINYSKVEKLIITKNKNNMIKQNQIRFKTNEAMACLFLTMMTDNIPRMMDTRDIVMLNTVERKIVKRDKAPRI